MSKNSPKAPQPEARQGRRGRPPRERQEAEAAILDTLKANGGRLSKNSTTRALGRMVSASRGTAHNALLALIAAGAVAKVGGALVLTS